MLKINFFRRFFVGHKRLITLWLFTWLLAGYFCAMASAQVTVSPIQGLGSVQFFDNNGETATSGVLYSFEAGTSTQQATYTDSTGTIQNPNPIPFGSGARVSIWLVSADFYKLVLCSQNDGASCAPSDVLFSVDNVPGNPAGATGGSPFTGIFISSTIAPATSGILRLATADTICWRNAAGTANLCLSKSTNDVLTWPGALTAANFVSACSPASVTGTIQFCDTDSLSWRNHAATADVALSKDSSDNLNWPNGLILGGPLTATTLNLSDVFTSTSPTVVGVAPEVSTPGTPPAATTQDWYFVAGKGLCTLDSASNEYCTVVSSGVVPPAVLASTTTVLSAPVTVSGLTTVMSQAITMPASGCPCRAFVSYHNYVNAATHGVGVFYVSDATHEMATSELNIYTDGNTAGMGAAAYSPVTYANSASVTFTLFFNEGTMSGSVMVEASNTQTSQNSWLDITILTSN